MLPPPQHHPLRLTYIQAAMERACLCVTTMNKSSSLCSYVENWTRELFHLGTKAGGRRAVMIFGGVSGKSVP